MQFWVGVTDNKWYKFISQTRPDEVNFWQPSGTPPFKNAPVGLPFLFKLKAPYSHIAGGGFFVTYTALPLEVAWDVFGQKNGCESLDQLRELIAPLTGAGRRDDQLGCSVLADPFFFELSEWITDLPGFSHNIVRGKMYDSTQGAGREIWQKIEFRLSHQVLDGVKTEGAFGSQRKFGSPVAIKPRLGQSSFRVLVTDAYQRRCAITGERTLVALEAAHIVPYSGKGGHDIRNGILLRADFHRLFDAGLISITPDLKTRISKRIKEEWYNGKDYYRLDNKPLSVVPTLPLQRPDPDRLDWHYRNRFQG